MRDALYAPNREHPDCTDHKTLPVVLVFSQHLIPQEEDSPAHPRYEDLVILKRANSSTIRCRL